ncbi:hypothetical protein T484DRAFT_1954958 [Baffinella frigidus]|nr:hypothetical protein T484DRAFT_1954958 [Cryptophyta sp. CCMP2293]
MSGTDKKDEVVQAKTLEEGLAEAQKWDGDPLDCPCIQHMKDGPCGADFVVAYRCFLDSKEDEKGADCIESFRTMQTCFATHPEHYAEFLSEDEEEEDADTKKRREETEWVNDTLDLRPSK